jgi:excisionase family DNA binding protein
MAINFAMNGEVHPVETKKLLTVKEVCDRLRISRSTFYRLVDQRAFKVVRFSPGVGAKPMIRVDAEDLETFIAASTQMPNEEVRR